MRRALMKKMKKGSLSPSEYRELKSLDREVNKANRQAAGAAGAGLGAALAIASKTGALDRAGDSLGAFLDSRAEARGERRAERADAQEEKERARDEAELSKRAAAAERSAEREEERELKELRKAQEANQEMREEKRARRRAEPAPELDPYLEAVRNMDGSVAVGPANKDQGVQARRQAEMAERRARKDAERENEENLRDLDPARRANRLQNEGATTSDDLVIDRDLYSRDQRRQMRRSGFNPETGEYLPSSREVEADQEFDRNWNAELDELAGTDEQILGRMENERVRRMLEAQDLASQVDRPRSVRSGDDVLTSPSIDAFIDEYALRDGARDAMLSNFDGNEANLDLIRENTERAIEDARRQAAIERNYYEPEVSPENKGPRFNDGGYTPFLRSMRNKLRKRFR